MIKFVTELIMTLNLKDVIIVKCNNFGEVSVTIGPLCYLITASFLVIMIFIKRKRLSKNWTPIEIEVPFGLGKVKIVPKNDIVRIAHQAWTEIVTRKVGIAFDEKNDVIEEVYNSWYEVFKEIRKLIKTIPAEELKNNNSDAHQLVNILLTVLNEGLRVHLTQWQARFRRWYKAEINLESKKSPQEIQQEFPEYQLLISDLKNVNSKMVLFAEQLHKITQSEKKGD